ncbi:hypothetical protein [Streptomyces sp. Ru73]|uniref:hypothetical protein n=1 Tax=Streptomyces sp. Ru73 TaxID=2080748 RepID=UPI0011B0DD5B|nr:hypothetical protein [Streptomyces sp. Ru73]
MASAVVVVLAVVLLAGCERTEGEDRAVGCAKFALAVSDAIGNLERSVLESALDQDATASVNALDQAVDRLTERSSGAEVQQAALAVREAADEVRVALDQGRRPDLAPLRSAGLRLIRACPNGSTTGATPPQSPPSGT